MMRTYKLSELLAELNNTMPGSRLLGADVEIKNLCSDTRSIKAGDLFVALKGPNFNGHKFISQAKAKGAVAALVDEPIEFADDQDQLPLLMVSDVLIAFGKIAAFNRQAFKGLVTAITGSAGKTSVKSMMADLLSVKGPVLSTRGNLNNHIGAPITLLEINQQVNSAVIELGASGQGEIDYTAQLTQPDIAVITNVSGAHLEGFGSIKIIAETKGEIIDALPAEGVAVLNHDDVYFSQWQTRAGQRRVISFGQHSDSDVRAADVRCHENGCQFTLVVGEQQQIINLPLLGEHNVSNALAAAAVAVAAGIELKQIAEKLEQLTAVAGRMQWRTTASGVKILDDSYNASPASVKAAIDVIKIWQDKAWLVLGDMAELGTEAKHIHQEIGVYAKQAGIKNVVAVGNYCRHLVESFAQGGHWFAHQHDLINYLQKQVKQDHVVLIKGARSAAMDNVVSAMVNPTAGLKTDLINDGEGKC